MRQASTPGQNTYIAGWRRSGLVELRRPNPSILIQREKCKFRVYGRGCQSVDSVQAAGASRLSRLPPDRSRCGASRTVARGPGCPGCLAAQLPRMSGCPGCPAAAAARLSRMPLLPGCPGSRRDRLPLLLPRMSGCPAAQAPRMVSHNIRYVYQRHTGTGFRLVLGCCRTLCRCCRTLPDALPMLQVLPMLCRCCRCSTPPPHPP